MNKFLTLYTNIICKSIDPKEIKTLDDFKNTLGQLYIGIGDTRGLYKSNFKLMKLLKGVDPEIIKQYIDFLNNLKKFKPDQYADGRAWYQEVDRAREMNKNVQELKDFFVNLKDNFKLYDQVQDTEFADLDENDFKGRKFENYTGSNKGNDFSYEKNKIVYKSDDPKKAEAGRKLQSSWLPWGDEEKFKEILKDDPNWITTDKTNHILKEIAHIIAVNSSIVYKKWTPEELKELGIKREPQILDHWDVDWQAVHQELVKSFYNEYKTDEEYKENIGFWIAALKAMKLNSMVKTFEKIQQKLETK